MEAPQTPSQIRTKIRGLTDLPPLPAVAQRLLNLLGDEEAKVEDLARVIDMDPGLSARIIGLSCSAYFGRARPICSVKEAIINVLGLDMVKAFALSLAVSGGFRLDRCPEFDLVRYWKVAMLTADLAMRLVTSISTARVPLGAVPTVQTAYLGGLWHDLGLMVLVHLLPQQMSGVLTALEGRWGAELIAAERERIGVDQHQAGSWLAHRWQLPAELVMVIMHHHELGYRGPAWPTCLLIGLCARWVQSRLDGLEDPMDRVMHDALGIPEGKLAHSIGRWERQVDGLSELAQSLAGTP